MIINVPRRSSFPDAFLASKDDQNRPPKLFCILDQLLNSLGPVYSRQSLNGVDRLQCSTGSKLHKPQNASKRQFQGFLWRAHMIEMTHSGQRDRRLNERSEWSPQFWKNFDHFADLGQFGNLSYFGHK